MKKIISLFFVFAIMLSASTFAYAYSVDEYRPDRDDIYNNYDYEEGYDDGYDDGYEDGVYESGGEIVYKRREVTLKEYVADHNVRFKEIYITLMIVAGFGLMPVLLYRFVIRKYEMQKPYSTIFSLCNCLLLLLVSGCVLYARYYYFPAISVIILWGIISQKILEKE